MKHLDFSKLEIPATNSIENSIPEKTGKIRKLHIKDKLKEIGVDLSTLRLGDFDQIGEHTAKKMRDPSSELYAKAGAYFRPNYERGILIYSLIKKFNLKSMLEIGFGRGYATMCASLAFSELGGGEITTVDPNLDEQFLNGLASKFPSGWFENIAFIKGTSQEYLPTLDRKFDMIFIDGDHRYEAVKNDWENCKDMYSRFLIFDDYHLPSKEEKDINCANVVDHIDDDTKELIIGDRRIFFDDRGYSDEEIDYGQVLLERK